MAQLSIEEAGALTGTVDDLTSACQLMASIDDIQCDCADIEDLTKLQLIAQASDMVAILTGGIIAGRCETTIRPCSDRSCGAGRGCSCCNLPGILLVGPEPNVTEVKVDGVVLTAGTDYKIVDDVYLVRTEPRHWPGCQDPLADDTEKGTFSVTYEHGLLPLLAKETVIEIVCDFIQSRPGQQSRKALPPNTRSANVAGVSIQFEPMMMEMKKRMLMLPKFIRLMSVYAPDGPNPAVVYSPELADGWVHHRVR